MGVEQWMLFTFISLNKHFTANFFYNISSVLLVGLGVFLCLCTCMPMLVHTMYSVYKQARD